MSEFIKRFLVQCGLYEATYDIVGSVINRPFREKSVNILHDQRLIFIHNPKCAGTSLKRVIGLAEHVGADHRVPTYMVHPKTWDAYFSFVVVRNPFERLVSAYAYHTSPVYNGFFIRRYPHLKGLDLNAYFELMRREPTAIRPQVDYLEHKRSVKQVDRICRMEQLSDDLAPLFDILGISGELPHQNRTEHKAYRDYFMDDRFVERVQKYYQEDLDMLGYEF